jgi:hypothetical protein
VERWIILVVSLRLGARPTLQSLRIGHGCSDEHGSLAAAYTWRLALRPPRSQMPKRSPEGTPGIAASEQLRCPLAEKGSFPKVTLDTPLAYQQQKGVRTDV